MPKLFGHLPDPPGEERGMEIGGLVGAAPAIPPSFALPLPGEVLSQEASNCVNCAFWCAVAIAGIRANRNIDMSVTAIYALARQLENPGAKVLPDVGCYPNKAVTAMETWGVVSRHRYADDANPTRPVPIDVLEAGAVAQIGGVFRIYETGNARVVRVKQAISQGHAVTFAMPVDDAFEAMKGGVYPGRTGASRGGHDQCLVGYRPGAFLVRGSWGRGFGIDGNVWVSEAWVANGECSDFMIVTLAPEGDLK